MEEKSLQELYLKFLEEKKQFQEEMKALNRKVLMERKRLKEDELFFEKKMDILKSGFAQLEADKQALQEERIRFEAEKDMARQSRVVLDAGSVKLLFKGINNPLALKKRYRDLSKIFHPDNLCGDTEVLQLINETYESLLEEIGWQKKA